MSSGLPGGPGAHAPLLTCGFWVRRGVRDAVNRLRAHVDRLSGDNARVAVPSVDGGPWRFDTRRFRRTLAWSIGAQPFGVWRERCSSNIATCAAPWRASVRPCSKATWGQARRGSPPRSNSPNRPPSTSTSKVGRRPCRQRYWRRQGQRPPRKELADLGAPKRSPLRVVDDGRKAMLRSVPATCSSDAHRLLFRP